MSFEYSYDIANYITILRDYALRSSFVLELGPAKGNGSTKAFEEGLNESDRENKLFISVDRQDYMEIKPTAPFWHLVLGDSREVETLKKVEKIAHGRKADLIFIDTHHTYEQMKQELSVWNTMAHDKTWWLFHDTYMMGEYNKMTDAIKEFSNTAGYKYRDISAEAHGLGLMEKLL